MRAQKMKYEVPDEKVMWKDRKRFLGMPLSFTRYQLTPTRLTVSVGLFSTHIEETLLYRILDSNLQRNFWQKIFGVGTVMVFAGDRSAQTVTLKNVRESEKVRRLLGELVEKEREAKRITAREMYGSGFGELDHDIDGDGIPDNLQ